MPDSSNFCHVVSSSDLDQMFCCLAAVPKDCRSIGLLPNTIWRNKTYNDLSLLQQKKIMY